MYIEVKMFDGSLAITYKPHLRKIIMMINLSAKLKSLLIASIALLSANSIASTTYTIDPTHTSVIASWNHFGFSNPTAAFSDVSGAITFDAEKPSASSIAVSVNT